MALTGVVKKYDAAKGFGFIVPTGTSTDLFVLGMDVMGGTLQAGDKVTFDEGLNERTGKPKAIRVAGGSGPAPGGKGGKGKRGDKGKGGGAMQLAGALNGGFVAGPAPRGSGCGPCGLMPGGGCGLGAGKAATYGFTSGVVKFFHNEKGYGFIKQNDGGNDLFVHRDMVIDTLLNAGDHVQYCEIVHVRSNRMCAGYVTGGTGAPKPPQEKGAGKGGKGKKGGTRIVPNEPSLPNPGMASSGLSAASSGGGCSTWPCGYVGPCSPNREGNTAMASCPGEDPQLKIACFAQLMNVANPSDSAPHPNPSSSERHKGRHSDVDTKTFLEVEEESPSPLRPLRRQQSEPAISSWADLQDSVGLDQEMNQLSGPMPALDTTQEAGSFNGPSNGKGKEDMQQQKWGEKTESQGKGHRGGWQPKDVMKQQVMQQASFSSGGRGHSEGGDQQPLPVGRGMAAGPSRSPRLAESSGPKKNEKGGGRDPEMDHWLSRRFRGRIPATRTGSTNMGGEEVWGDEGEERRERKRAGKQGGGKGQAKGKGCNGKGKAKGGKGGGRQRASR